MKRLFSVFLAVSLVLSLNTVGFAASGSATGLGETQQDIDVNATYSASVSTPDVVSVDISWGAMEFTYSVGGANNWNPGTHSYTENTTGSWSASGNTLTVTNHSNVAIEAELSFTASASGITGAFTESSGTANDNLLSLASAVNTTVANAPSATATFNITGGKVTANGSVGSITVSISKGPVAQLGADTMYDLYSTSQAGVYTATVKQGNATGNYNHFIYLPQQFVGVGIAEVEKLIAADSSITGIVLDDSGDILTINSGEDSEEGIYLNSDSEFRITINFNTMKWTKESIE